MGAVQKHSCCVCRCTIKPASSAACVTKAWTPPCLLNMRITSIAKVCLLVLLLLYIPSLQQTVEGVYVRMFSICPNVSQFGLAVRR